MSNYAQEISDLIYGLNEKYSATFGDDLFKMTNRTSNALKTFSRVVRDRNGYEALIDALYFLIYEGSGDCNRLPQPPHNFAMEIKLLRTGLRHDVDHGSKAEVRAKKKAYGALFKRVTGKSTLGECREEDLIAAQLRLFGDVISFLKTIGSQI